MKILVHTISYYPEMVGVAKYITEMCEWLAARGHQVEVVCPPPYYPRWKVEPPYRQWLYRRERTNGVDVTRCPIWLPKQPRGLQRILYSLSFVISSLPVMAGKLFGRSDVVFVVEPSFLNTIPALFMAKLIGALSWLEIKDFEIDIAFDLGHLKYRRLRSGLLHFESRLMRGFDVVSTISRSMQKKARAKGVDKTHLVFFPDWVDTNVIFPMTSASPLRAELGISESAIVALFSGALNAKSGAEVLIAAARHIAESVTQSKNAANAPILFLICGDGPTTAELQSLAKGLPNVRFIPLQSPERLNALLNIADLHLLPQLGEVADLVLPSKLLGMLASGRPIVATVRPESEVGQIVANCGVIVPPGDFKALSNAVQMLADEGDQRGRMGAEARNYAVLRLRQELILNDFERELGVRLAAGAGELRAMRKVAKSV